MLFFMSICLKNKMQKIVVFSAFIGFFFGWILACIFLQRQFLQRQLRSQEQLREDTLQYSNNVKSLRQEIYGSNKFHREDASPDTKELLTSFVPSTNDEYISLAYVGDFGALDYRLTLCGNGSLYKEALGKHQLISNIPRDQCSMFFHHVLTSGILNYSESIVSLKVDLLNPLKLKGVTDRPTTEIRISIPKLKIDKFISVYAPDIELQNFPDIIEFQLVTQIEKEILDLR
jgi:hypothetical protein